MEFIEFVKNRFRNNETNLAGEAYRGRAQCNNCADAAMDLNGNRQQAAYRCRDQPLADVGDKAPETLVLRGAVHYSRQTSSTASWRHGGPWHERRSTWSANHR